jgi:hypothetical protein
VCGDCLCGAQTIRGVLHDARLSLDHTRGDCTKFHEDIFWGGVTQLISLTARDLSGNRTVASSSFAKWTVLKNYDETTALCERLGSSHS